VTIWIMQEVELQITDLGFLIVENNQTFTKIDWSEIIEIIAFKKDLLTTDLICFEFKTSSAKEVVYFVIHEEMVGFDKLADHLKLILPGFNANWRQLVVLPPFASNSNLIYRRFN
jgi:hypothetical protein